MTHDERNALIESCIPLARSMVTKNGWRAGGIEYDDKLSLAYLGLIYAADHYNPEIGAFSTYACNIIKGTLSRPYKLAIKKKRIPQNQIISLDAPVKSTEGAMRISDIVPDRKRFEEHSVNRIILRDALEKLCERDQKLISINFVLDMTQTECKRVLGISQAHVSRLRKRALTNMRNAIVEAL